MVDLPAYVVADGKTLYCLIYDITPAGARLRVVAGGDLIQARKVSIDLEGYGQIPAEVRHSALGVAGLAFLHGANDETRFAHWLTRLRPHRRQRRYNCHLPAVLVLGTVEIPCVITDLSRSGAAAQVEPNEHLARGSEVELILPSFEPITASVRHVEGGTVGLLLIDGYQGELPPQR
jgi:hypothetical protein